EPGPRPNRGTTRLQFRPSSPSLNVRVRLYDDRGSAWTTPRRATHSLGAANEPGNRDTDPLHATHNRCPTITSAPLLEPRQRSGAPWRSPRDAPHGGDSRLRGGPPARRLHRSAGHSDVLGNLRLHRADPAPTGVVDTGSDAPEPPGESRTGTEVE